MNKQRLRPDWPRAVFKYSIMPVGDIPQSVWDTAKLMQALWNRLVALHDTALEDVANLDKAATASRYKDFWRAMYDCAKDSPGLNHSQKWDVHDRFRDSVKRFYKKQGGKPKFRGGLRRIRIPYTNTQGGWEADWLNQDSDRKVVRLKAVSEDAYIDDTRKSRRDRGSRGYMRIGGGRMPFQVNLHRPLPSGAMIKEISLIGKFSKALGWDWSLDVCIEYPPDTHRLSISSGRVAALDIGWRKFDDYIRLGVLGDSDGSILELRLPFDLSNRRTRRLNAFIAGKGSDYRTIDDFRDLEELQGEQAQSLEDAKFKISVRLDELPADLRPNKNSLRLMRQGGLYRLLRGLQEQHVAPEIQAILSDFIGRDRSYARRIESARKRMIARRNWLYGNIAAWLAERYDMLILEGDFDLSKVASQEEQDESIKASQKYRQMAALYVLRGAIKNAFDKARREIIPSPAAYSTQTCAECGGHIDNGPALVLVCENGHKQDQDVNTVKLFLVEAGVNLQAMPGFRPSVDLSRFDSSIVDIR